MAVIFVIIKEKKRGFIILRTEVHFLDGVYGQCVRNLSVIACCVPNLFSWPGLLIQCCGSVLSTVLCWENNCIDCVLNSWLSLLDFVQIYKCLVLVHYYCYSNEANAYIIWITNTVPWNQKESIRRPNDTLKSSAFSSIKMVNIALKGFDFENEKNNKFFQSMIGFM